MIRWGSCLLKISRHQHLLIGHFLVCMFHNINFLFWQCSLNTLGNCFHKASTRHGIQGKSCGRSRLLLNSAPSPKRETICSKLQENMCTLPWTGYRTLVINIYSNTTTTLYPHPRLQHAPFLSCSSLTIVQNSTICESQQQQDLVVTFAYLVLNIGKGQDPLKKERFADVNS